MRAVLGFLVVLLALSGPLAASEPQAEPERGPVTNLPIPRFVSLKSAEANVRRGPSLTHRIDWVFQRRHMPVQVTAEYGHWRRVSDIDGAGGWVHYSLLSGMRYVVVTGPDVVLLTKPELGTRPVAHVRTGVVARLGDCSEHWCKVTAEGKRGWTPKTNLWGVDPKEVRD